MRRIISTLIVMCLLSFGVSAQTASIKGIATDKTDSKPLSGATVELLRQADSSLIGSTVTSPTGVFSFNGVPVDSVILTINPLGFQQYVSFLTLRAEERDLGSLTLERQGTDLSVVTVVARQAPVTQKGDTAQFNASQFKVNPDANAEDLIKKMPGITVDRAGTVTAQGEQVRKVTVDGRDFFGDDASATLKNLPAEIIDKIQVFDRLSDQAQFTGFDDGSGTKSINIVTKANNRNGQFGRVYAGVGTDERYTAGGNISMFKKDRRLSFVGLFNNVNQQNFSSEDLLGVSGGGGSRGGGGRGGGGGNFFVGQQSGISTTNAFGVNYSDIWSKKLTVAGSYFFNNSKTTNDQIVNREFTLPDTLPQYYDETTLSDRDNFNNRINMRLEYKLDSSNSFIFSPNISFQNNDAEQLVNGVRHYSNGEELSRTIFNNASKTSGYNMNNNLLWRHAFPKKGRTISVNLRQALNNRVGDIYLQSINEFQNGVSDTLDQFTDQLTNSKTYSANISYTEPIGKKGQLQLNYSPSVTNSESDQKVMRFDNLTNKYNVFDTTLSNKFDNTSLNHTAGASYRVGDRNNMFAIGVDYKYSELSSEQIFPRLLTVNKSFNNLLPNLMVNKKLTPNASLRIFYRSSINVPSVNQLQNVVDNSNPLFLTMGNPDLKQQFSNMVNARYTYTNTKKGTSFFANLFLQQANNYVTDAVYRATTDSVISEGIILPRGGQLTRPVNADGYTSLRSFLTYSVPVKSIKSNINLNGGFTWSKLPGFVNDIKGETNNLTYSGGIVVSSNISEFVDFNVSYNANYSVVDNSLNPLLDNNYLIQNAGTQINLLSKKGWFVQNDVSNQSYKGLSEGFNQSYWLWNAAIGKKFLKNQAGELKLSVFDLLKQNRSITRNVQSTYVEDVQNQVLQQYFMLTFSYKLRNFGVSAQQQQRGPGGPGGPGMMMRPGF